jgi:PBP1b-binding outer membrane lipoprotein LpoB
MKKLILILMIAIFCGGCCTEKETKIDILFIHLKFGPCADKAAEKPAEPDGKQDQDGK